MSPSVSHFYEPWDVLAYMTAESYCSLSEAKWRCYTFISLLGFLGQSSFYEFHHCYRIWFTWCFFQAGEAFKLYGQCFRVYRNLIYFWFLIGTTCERSEAYLWYFEWVHMPDSWLFLAATGQHLVFQGWHFHHHRRWFYWKICWMLSSLW